MKKTYSTLFATLAFAVSILPAIKIGAQECKYDVTGDYFTFSGIHVFNPDGKVTLGNIGGDWYMGDVATCYEVYNNPTWLAYPNESLNLHTEWDKCDLNTDGVIDFGEVVEMYYRTQPGYFHSMQFDSNAAAAAMEHHETSPFVYVSDGSLSTIGDAIATLREEYPSIQEIDDPLSVQGGGQSFKKGYYYDSITCSVDPMSTSSFLNLGHFEQLNVCYGGTPEGLLPYQTGWRSLLIRFKTPINVTEVLADYDELAQTKNASCSYHEVFSIYGAASSNDWGYHIDEEVLNKDATGLVTAHWLIWDINTTAQCSMLGCDCDQTVSVFSDLLNPGIHFEEAIIDNSNTDCAHPGF